MSAAAGPRRGGAGAKPRRARKGAAGQTLVVLPDDGMAPLLNAIRAARASILVKMFLFTEPRLIRALAAVRKRGAFLFAVAGKNG